MSAHAESAVRPEPDLVLQDIAECVHNYRTKDPLTWDTARLCLIDTIKRGFQASRFPACADLLRPVWRVPSFRMVRAHILSHLAQCRTSWFEGTKAPAMDYKLDSIRGAFNIGTQVRWLGHGRCPHAHQRVVSVVPAKSIHNYGGTVARRPTPCSLFRFVPSFGVQTRTRLSVCPSTGSALCNGIYGSSAP